MADELAFKHAKVREEILKAVRMDLIGPQSENEELDEMPTNSYITGMLFPADTEMSEDENYDAQNFETDFKEDNDTGNTMEDVDPDDDKPKGGFKKQSSLGVSCYIRSDVTMLNTNIAWGTYEKESVKVMATIKGVEKEVTKTLYVREQENDVVTIDMRSFDRFTKIPLNRDSHLVLHVVKMNLEDGNTMLSVYLYNQRPSGDNEKEYEKVLYQVELTLCDDQRSPVFLPEHKCRKIELEDEYYYESRAVYARGRGCAATWEKTTDSENAIEIKSMFIPDYEINGVSPNIPDFEKNTFSMRFMSLTKNRNATIERLSMLSNLYKKWIDELNDSHLMKNPSFIPKGQKIIAECQTAQKRIQKGIELLATNENAFSAFCFMNQAMYMQRSIAMFGKKNSQGIPCSLSDFTKEDHSEWRPFQIAFVLLNLFGCMDPASDERKNVDLLYFPTGGGKTEAYLGLIAFVIGYRRLTAPLCSEYEKDGGVTVFLRYTLRLLTTQQRDRLIKLIVAAEMIREKHPDIYGNSRISIGFWVGGGVTPNNFSDYDDREKRKDFLRKVSKQVIICPCCGKPIEQSDYEVDSKLQTVKITCSNNKCYFYKHDNHTLPVYLIDSEIYRKCPTVIISTVDKFARLPWDEKTGLLFGNADRYCARCGYVAKGEGHKSRHNKTADLPSADVVDVRPFYPPELIIQDELHLITGPLGTIYGGYENIVEELCSITEDDKKILPKYIVSTATIKNAGEQIRCLYGRNKYSQFPPSGIDIRDSYFIKEISLEEKPFRKYAGICGNGQSVKTTLLRTYSIILEAAFELSRKEEFRDFIDPYYTLIGYFNSIRELGGAVRLLEDDIKSRIERLQKKYGHEIQRYLRRTKEITSRIPSYEIAKVLEDLTIPYDKNKADNKQDCYDVVIATNMIAVGMDVDRLGLMTVVGQPKQNSEYIQATSRVGRSYPGIVFTVYNPYRPRDLSHYENFEGFHSQLYRYVEGTTATPFSARARDRVLHAIVVALLRLQNEHMAPNAGANEISNITEAILQQMKEKILNRVKVVAHKAYYDVEKEINLFIEDWIALSTEEKTLTYFINDIGLERFNRLLNYYDKFCTPKEKPTLNSMREVERAATIYYFNEEDN